MEKDGQKFFCRLMKKKTPSGSKNAQNGKGSSRGCSCQERVFDEFLEDVEKDMKRERYQEIWARHGKLISTVTTAVLGGILVFAFWQRYDKEQREELSTQFLHAQALQSEGKTDDALEIMRMLAAKSQKGYAVIAQLSQAALLADQNFAKNADEIQVLYKGVLESSAPVYYKALAAVQYVNAGLQKLGTGELDAATQAEWLDLLRRFKGEQGMGLAASEVEAFVLFKAGALDEARKVLNELSKNPKAPQAMQLRVGMMIQAIQDKRSA